jgi:predicted kinase
MSELVLIRGLPGSGKTTLAKEKFPNHALIEADQWFETKDGYRWDFQDLPDAHIWCQKQTECLLRQGKNVVVANTFVQRWEMSFYVAIAVRTRSSLKVITAKGSYKNIHGVPEENIDKMMKQWELFDEKDLVK